MGTQVIDAPYIGLLIPADQAQHGNLRVNDAAAGNSDYNQAGPRPGIPEFDQDEVAAVSATAGDYSPSLSLEGLGEQDPDTSYHVKVVKGGLPGRDCTVVQRAALTTAQPWKGHNTHNVLGHFERDHLVDRDTGGQVNYAACRTADDQALFAWWDNNTVKVRKYNPETHVAAASVTVVDAAAAINADGGIYPPFAGSVNLVDVLTLPSGRVLVYFLTREVNGNTTNATLWAAYSDDHAATWRTAQYLGLDSPIDTTGDELLKLRAAYSNESVLLVVELDWGANRGFLQFASDDTGLNFVLVKDDQADAVVSDPSHPDIVVDPVSGVFNLVFEDDATNRLLVRRFANPYRPYDEGDLVVMLPGLTADHIVAYDDTDGSLYVTYDTTDGIDLYRSRDGGTTWTQLEEPFNWNNGNVEFVWEVAAAGGRAIWMIGQTVGPGSLPLGNHKFVFVEAGGWNTICQPRILGTSPTINRGFGSTVSPEAGTWIPTDKPEDFGWTLTGPTVAVSGVVPLGLNITSLTHYSVVPAGNDTDGMEVYFGLEVDSTPLLTALEVGLHLILDTFEIEVRFDATQVRIHDVHAAATVGTASPSGGMGSEQVFKLALRKSDAGATACSVTLYRRAPSTDVWEQLITTSSLTNGASVANLIDWGNFAAGEDSTWTFLHWVMDTGSGEQGDYFDDLSQDVLDQDPLVLYGAPLPAPPHRLYIDQQLYLRGTSGPGTRGDTWKVEPSFDYPVSSLDWRNSATPSRGWRSTDETQKTFAYDCTLDSTLGNSSIGLFLAGVNFREAQLLGWNGAAWVTLAQAFADQGLNGLACTVTGDTVQVNTGASVDARYIQYGEFVGGTVAFNGGDKRRIVWNSEGTFTDNTTKRPVFRFEGTAPGGATVTCQLWHPSMLVLLHENLTLYDRYALRIPAQSTVDGYFEIGVAFPGAAVLFGFKNARGRVIQTTPNYELLTDRAGLRTARKLGSSRRAVSLGWSDRDLTAISGATPDPDYIGLRATAPAVADRFGTALLLEGLQEHLGGAYRPVVYIPNIPATTPGNDETRLCGQEYYVYGRVVGTLSRVARLGTEVSSEVVNLSGFRLEEEL